MSLEELLIMLVMALAVVGGYLLVRSAVRQGARRALRDRDAALAARQATPDER